MVTTESILLEAGKAYDIIQYREYLRGLDDDDLRPTFEDWLNSQRSRGHTTGIRSNQVCCLADALVAAFNRELESLKKNQ